MQITSVFKGAEVPGSPPSTTLGYFGGKTVPLQAGAPFVSGSSRFPTEEVSQPTGRLAEHSPPQAHLLPLITPTAPGQPAPQASRCSGDLSNQLLPQGGTEHMIWSRVPNLPGCTRPGFSDFLHHSYCDGVQGSSSLVSSPSDSYTECSFRSAELGQSFSDFSTSQSPR